VDVTEGYLEVNLPILQDRPGAKKLEFNVAARESQYKNKGGFGTTGEEREHNLFTWKVQAIWDPVDWLRFRGTQSRDSRAANFRELYYGQFIQAGGVFGFCAQPGAAFGTDPCTWSLEGNTDLKPEKSDTTTLGLVFTPKESVPGLQFAADYFRISITDAIQQANVRRVLDGCQISNIQEFCNLLTFDGTTYQVNGQTFQGVSFLRALSFNGSGYTFKGVDFTGSYSMELGEGSNLNFRLIATKMIDQNFQSVPGGPFINVVGQTGTANSFLSDNQPTAEWIANLSTTWNKGPVSLTGQVRYVGDGVMNYNGVVFTGTQPTAPRVSADRNRVPSYAVFSLNGSYTFSDMGPLKSLQVFASVDNLFDRTPPVATGTGFGGAAFGGTNAVFYDTLGRAYRLGLRTTF
jgi:outer membrane receptor protein involved in Fe transport